MKQIKAWITKFLTIHIRVAAAFVLLLWLLETYLFASNKPESLLTHPPTLTGFEVFSSLIFSWLSILLVLVFVNLSLQARGGVRWFYFGLFGFALFFEYNYQAVFARFSTAQDLIIALTPLDMEIGQDAILAYGNPVVILPLLLYAALLLKIKPEHITTKSWYQLYNSRGRKTNLSLSYLSRCFLSSYKSGLLLVLLLLGIFVFYSSLYPLNNSQFATVSLSAFFRTVTFAAWDISSAYRGPREKLAWQNNTPPTNNIIFIVDESVRADHLNLNGYQRPTTPYLDELEQQGLLYNWGLGRAGEACSLTANNLLLSGINHLAADKNLIKRKPTIFQYAQARGYKTYHFNATSNQFWIGTAADLNYIDVWWPKDHFLTEPRFDIDFNLAQQTAQLVAKSQGNFIWINKRGLHFNYNSHYPPTATRWQPVGATRFKVQAQAELVNAYDNAIRYNVNNFFYHLLESQPNLLEQTTILYTSDHGQTLSEHGETWTHCVGTPNELLVPIFMISATPRQINTPSPASHFNIFATLLDLMAFPSPERVYPYAPSLLK